MVLTLPPRVGLRVGARVLPAIPVLLRGHEASLLLAAAAPPSQDVRLVLDWEDGAVTELGACVRAVEEDGLLAHLDVLRVAGDWRPFLQYLGQQEDSEGEG